MQLWFSYWRFRSVYAKAVKVTVNREKINLHAVLSKFCSMPKDLLMFLQLFSDICIVHIFSSLSDMSKFTNCNFDVLLQQNELVDRHVRAIHRLTKYFCHGFVSFQQKA